MKIYILLILFHNVWGGVDRIMLLRDKYFKIHLFKTQLQYSHICFPFVFHCPL